MAAIYLGTNTSGSELHLLPPIRWMRGQAPDLSIDAPKAVDQATMLDGSWHFNHRDVSPRRWPLSWQGLTSAELAVFLALRAENGPLYFQNNWESAEWWIVSIVDFQYVAQIRTGATPCLYDVQMTLMQAGA